MHHSNSVWKRLISMLLVVAMLLPTLTGCFQEKPSAKEATESALQLEVPQ